MMRGLLILILSKYMGMLTAVHSVSLSAQSSNHKVIVGHIKSAEFIALLFLFIATNIVFRIVEIALNGDCAWWQQLISLQ
jgi:hypothetical protein